MSISSIQNQLLEITVVECAKLKDTEWISRQDPYVVLEYGSTKFRTRTCTDGGKTPVFQEKFMFTLIEGLREINVAVWNSNTIYSDDFIGNGKILLQDVLSRGFDDKCWPIHTKNGRFAGEVKLIMHYAKPNESSEHKPNPSAVFYGSSAPPYIAPQIPPYSVPPPASTSPYTNAACPPPYLAPTSTYPPSMPHCTSSYPSYPPPPPPHHHQQAYTSYPSYPPPPGRSVYPPPPDGYPTTTYPPPPEGYPTTTYPPPPHASPYATTPGHYGMYPAPPY